jgi:hypothetical protein
LVPHFAVADIQIYGIADIEAIGVVGCREAFGDGVWGIAERVI